MSSSLVAPPVPQEFRGVWVATVDNIDWPSKRTLSTAQQKAELDGIIQRCAELNLNAIVFQIRPSADSLYKSKLEPWSEYLTGQTGKAPSPAWDPLEYIIDKAHDCGIEVHAWFNPYRAKHPAAKGDVSSDHIVKTHPKSAPKYGRYNWMIPTDPFVQKRSRDVFMDAVRRYDLDGIHIDDYFYPYAEKGPDGKNLPFPDEGFYKTYRDKGGKLSVGDWRRKAVDDFVRDVYLELKRTKRWVKFGISPFGIWRPGFPAGTTAGIDQYDALYADCKKWFNEGWLDYMTPQLYWPIAQKAQAYTALLDWWKGENTKGRHLWPGNYTGRVMETWEPKEVLDQIAETRARVEQSGNVHFSMKVFMRNSKGLNDLLLAGPYAEKAVVPPSPWLGDAQPAAPTVRTSGNTLRLVPMSGARFWVIASENGDVIKVASAKMSEIVLKPSELGALPIESMKVCATSLTGVLGYWADVK
ncbi:MAG: family 10 glycosylhydrolase [Chthonomonas sp.]|nr:family 10 glycosylhydrolase [Chthonomonas sp.]